MYLENQEIISLHFVFQKSDRSGRSERLRSAICGHTVEVIYIRIHLKSYPFKDIHLLNQWDESILSNNQ